MTNLYVSLYPEKNEARRKELETCLLRNLSCPDIDRVFVLAEKFDQIQQLEHEKLVYLPVTTRPTFRTFFKAINHITGPEDVNIVANSDIYFESIPVLPNADQCFALTRYELDGPQPWFLNRSDSQDAWCFRGRVRIPNYCHFILGRPGCDNRIARELAVVGYDVTNPSLTIKCFHLHAGQKSYSDTTLRVQPPYLKLNPTI